MSLFFCQFPFLYLFFKLVDGNRLIIDRWYYIWSGNLSDFNLSQGKIILFNFLLKSIHKFLFIIIVLTYDPFLFLYIGLAFKSLRDSLFKNIYSRCQVCFK